MKESPESQKSKKPSKGENEEVILSASFPELVDLVMENERISYLLKASNALMVDARFVHAPGQVFEPPDLSAIPFRVLPAQKILEHEEDDDQELYWEVLTKLKNVAVLPSEEYYHLVTVYIFFTYLPEAFSYYPYIWFFGLPERGKSRIMKATVNLAYRGLYTETLNQAYIFRFAERFCGTIGIDVYELLGQAHKKGSYDLLLGRYERGIKVPRVTDFGKGAFKDTVYYDVSGPTIFATNREIPASNPLRSRCIQIVMPEARGKYPNNNSSEALIDLKAKLLAFRGRHLGGEPLPEADKPIAGRLGDITQPLLSVAAFLPQEATANLSSLIEDLEAQRKTDQAQTLAGRIASGLDRLWEEGEVQNGRLPVGKLGDMLKKSNTLTSPQAIGRELTALGIPRIKSVGTMHIIWDQELMSKIWERYGIPGKRSP